LLFDSKQQRHEIRTGSIDLCRVECAGWSVYAQPDHSTNSSRLTFVSPSGIKMRSLKEVDKFLKETANAARIPVKGGLVEAEMQDPHSKNNEWVQGTITKVLAKNSGFKVSFKVENADERGIWEETYKVCISKILRLLPPLFVRASVRGSAEAATRLRAQKGGKFGLQWGARKWWGFRPHAAARRKPPTLPRAARFQPRPILLFSRFLFSSHRSRVFQIVFFFRGVGRT